MLKARVESFGGGRFPVNRRLIEALGPQLAVYITDLVDKLCEAEENESLDEYGGFAVFTGQGRLGMSKHILRKLKKELKEMGVLETKLKGVPAKEFYYLKTWKLDKYCYPEDYPDEHEES